MKLSIFFLIEIRPSFLLSFDRYRLKMSPLSVKLDLHFNGEVLSSSDDRKLVGQIPFKDRTVSEDVIFILNTFIACSPLSA